jgi:hypothetical protein
MRYINVVLLLAFAISNALSGEIVIQKVKGEVMVRSGVDEEWNLAKSGAILKPKDTVKTGKKGSAVLTFTENDRSAKTKKIVLPAEVILDLLDVRTLSQEELILQLTMEKVRASSYEDYNGELQIPNTTVVHGEKPAQSLPVSAANLEQAKFQMNGARVLFSHGFYSTCAVKAENIMNRFPSLGSVFQDRMMLAESLERSNLNGEALDAYLALSTSRKLTPKQQSLVDAKVARLRKEG